MSIKVVVYFDNLPRLEDKFHSTTYVINAQANTIQKYEKGAFNPNSHGAPNSIKEPAINSFLSEEALKQAQVKISYAQIHAIASKHPDKRVEFKPCQSQFTSEVYLYFKNNPSKLPANVIFGIEPDLIRGKGKIDKDYELNLDTLQLSKQLPADADTVLTKEDHENATSVLKEKFNQVSKSFLGYEQIQAIISNADMMSVHPIFDSYPERRAIEIEEIKAVALYITQPNSIDALLALKKAANVHRVYYTSHSIVEKLMTKVIPDSKDQCLGLLIDLERALNFPRHDLPDNVLKITQIADSVYHSVKNRLSENYLSEAEYTYIAKTLILVTDMVDNPDNCHKAHLKLQNNPVPGFFDKTYSLFNKSNIYRESEKIIRENEIVLIKSLLKGFFMMAAGIAVAISGNAGGIILFALGEQIFDNACKQLHLYSDPIETELHTPIENSLSLSQ